MMRREDQNPINGSNHEEAVINSRDRNSTGPEGARVAADDSKKRKWDDSVQPISCELCKVRKVRCDRGYPACGWCLRNKRLCVYEARKKPGIRVDYGRELEDKIKTLEATLHVLGRRVEDHIANVECSTTMVATAQPAVEPSNDQFRAADSSDGHRSVEAPSTPPQTYLWSSYIETAPTTSTLSTGQANDSELPPQDLLYTIVDLYFKHVNPWSPILDRKATLMSLFDSTVDESDRILLHAIVATTLRFLKDSRITPELKNHYYNISRRKVQLYGLEHANVRALQAMVILALDILGTSNGPQGWNLLILIARNIVRLGLSVEMSLFGASQTHPLSGKSQPFLLPRPTSWIEDEGRRRLCWITYALDRYATVATAFDFILDDKDMERPLPCRYDLFSKNEPVETKWVRLGSPLPDGLPTAGRTENLGSFSYHCEVLSILSRIDKFVKKPININSYTEVHDWRETYRALDGELGIWLQSLPSEYGKISELCHSDPASRISNWIMLHAAFVTSVIRLHSTAAYPTIRSAIFTSSHTAMQSCLSAVESLREIVRDVIDTHMLDLLGPPLAFSLWVSARVLLVHAAAMKCDVDPKIQFFIVCLERMGEYWKVAAIYADTLRRIMEEVAIGGSRALSTMRECVYELNLVIGQRPNTVSNPASIRVASSIELEYLDVFDFFNYPRPAPGTQPPQMILETAATDLRSDWLVFEPPCD